jgi:hypothetical protein
MLFLPKRGMRCFFKITSPKAFPCRSCVSAEKVAGGGSERNLSADRGRRESAASRVNSFLRFLVSIVNK